MKDKFSSFYFLDEIFDNKEVVPTAIHERMMGLFKEYIVVGGMPRVVDNFVKNHNFANVLKLQRGIINDYEDDIAKYAGSLMRLYDAGIINFCHNLEIPQLPLEGNSRSDVFKVYMRDTGLLLSMLDDGSQEDIIDGNLGIYKGAIYENIIADILAKKGKKLYYFEYNSTLEVDFITRYEKEAMTSG